MATQVFRVLKFAGVPQPKPLHGFSPNFQDVFTPRGSRADYVLRGIQLSLLPWQHFSYFQVLNFVGVPQLKPMHGFSPNFQDMCTQEDLQLIRFWAVSNRQLLP